MKVGELKKAPKKKMLEFFRYISYVSICDDVRRLYFKRFLTRSVLRILFRIRGKKHSFLGNPLRGIREDLQWRERLKGSLKERSMKARLKLLCPERIIIYS